MSEVGVRELRQNLSRYLARVRHGERLVITERNRPVARLEPLAEQTDPLARLVAEGRVRAPTGSPDSPLPLPIKLPGSPYALSEALEEVRDER